MPKRPREHELDDLSRRAFAAAIPSRFAFEDRRNDYGIDGSVEIFRESETTGLFFDVQFKGTDRSLEEGLKTYISHEHAQYYRSLDRPVLMVRYHAPSDDLYIRWFHSFDPHYGGVNDNTITFTWVPQDVWSDDMGARLEAEVGAFRRFRSAALDLPLRLRIRSEDDELHGLPAPRLIENIRGVLNEAGTGLIELPERGNDLPEIRLAQVTSVIDLQSVTTATLHHEEGGPERQLDRFAFDIGLGIALALDQVGHDDLAARLAIRTAAKASLIEEPDVLFWIVGVLARTHRIHEALHLADVLSERQESGARASSEIIRLLPGLMALQPLDPSEREAQIRALERQAEASDTKGDLKGARTAHYNLARQLRHDDPGRSLFHFYEAVRCDPGYLNRDYFCKEVAALFFVNGHYQFAIQFYERALDLGAGGLTRVLLGDALLFAGRYRRAYETFSSALEDEQTIPIEFYLKFRATGWLLSSLELDSQERKAEVAERLAMEAQPGLSAEERVRLCLEALSQDALCGPAWHTLGVTLHDDVKDPRAFRAFVLAAVIEPWNVGAWTNAIATVPDGESEDEQEMALLAGAVIAAAHTRHGDSLEAALTAGMTGDNEVAKDQFLEEFRVLVDSVREEEQDELELRLLGEEGDAYSLIKFPRGGRLDF